MRKRRDHSREASEGTGIMVQEQIIRQGRMATVSHSFIHCTLYGTTSRSQALAGCWDLVVIKTDSSWPSQRASVLTAKATIQHPMVRQASQ